MNPAQQLYELQQLDLEIAADEAKLESDRSKFQEPRSLREARSRAMGAEKALLAAAKALREAEAEIETIEAKKKVVHDKLYGGRVTVPRELSALEQEETALTQMKATVEDRTLELMSNVESAEKSNAEATTTVATEMERWKREGGEAFAHIPQMELEVLELKGNRDAAAAALAPNLLATYERLKPRKGNRPVALVDKGSCQGCGVQLPSGEIQRARAADPPQACDNCGRILYVR